MQGEYHMKLILNKKEEMTPLERARAIKQKKDFDRIIMDPFLGEIKARLINKNTREYWTNEDNLVNAEILAFNRYRADSLGVGPNAYGIAEAMGVIAHYPENGLIYVKKHPIDSIDEIHRLKKISLSSGKLQMYYNASQRLAAASKGICSVGASVSGPITLASFVLGTDKLLKAMIKSPDKVHELLAYVSSSVKYVVDEFSNLGLAFSMADPIASTTMLSPKMYETFALPYTKEISSYIYKKSASMPSYHVCGDTKKIWDKIAGLDISLFSVDNQMDIDETCNYFAKSKAVAGNVNPVSTIARGSIEDIYAEVKKCMLAGTKCEKGFVLTPGCNLPLYTSDEKIDAFLDAGKKYSYLFKT